jgi:hypothetical protein
VAALAAQVTTEGTSVCKDDGGGGWKEVFWGSPWQVKIAAKRDECKEEVRCDRDR